MRVPDHGKWGLPSAWKWAANAESEVRHGGILPVGWTAHAASLEAVIRLDGGLACE